MSLDRVRSSLFVGRSRELSFFKTFLQPDSLVNTLNISSNGDGGIGKTRLLAEMIQYCERESETILFTTEFIDFYHANSHSRLGVMQQIIENLDSDGEAFSTFRQGLEEYSATDDQVRRQQLFPELQAAFVEDFCDFVNAESLHDKRIVVFFDTYEVIQGDEIESEGRKYAKATDFSAWLEKEFFPKLFSAPNVRLVVSGRYPLRDKARNSLKWIDLAHFDRSETLEFWMKCFAVDSPKELIRIFGTEANLETLYLLSDGRPILLALFADWVNYERNPPFAKGTVEGD